MTVSVLLIGAGGAFGDPLLRELIRQVKIFRIVAVLSSDEKKAKKFK